VRENGENVAGDIYWSNISLTNHKLKRVAVAGNKREKTYKRQREWERFHQQQTWENITGAKRVKGAKRGKTRNR